MKRRRYYNPFPMPITTRRQRMDDAIDRDIARARPNPLAAANDAKQVPAQEQPTEGEKKNG